MKRAKKIFESEGISVQPYPVDFKSNKSQSSYSLNKSSSLEKLLEDLSMELGDRFLN